MDKSIKVITTATGGVEGLSAKMLDYTLKHNLNQVDDIIIATDFASPDVEKVCNKYNIKFIKTNKFYENNAKFDKGKVISQILKDETNGWVLHMDCDILLPKSFRKDIQDFYLDKNVLYGARRIMFRDLKDAEQWFIKDENPIKLSDEIPYGYCWGYFQLFNMQSLQILNSNKEELYPSSGHVGDSDGWFRNRWGVMIEKSYKKGQFMPAKNDLIVIGNIIELPFLVGHLGVSSVNNQQNIDFFNRL
jgi:hypothetical protein